MHGHLETVKVLVQANADMDRWDTYVRVKYNKECMYCVRIITLLAIWPWSFPQNQKYTALMWAAVNDHVEVVKVLVQAGADVTFKKVRQGVSFAHDSFDAALVRHGLIYN